MIKVNVLNKAVIPFYVEVVREHGGRNYLRQKIKELGEKRV